jgi:esterase
MNLNYKELGQGEPIIILHGLFGSSDNWLSVAKVLANERKVYLPDLRNHGDSPNSEAFNYDVMVDDLILFMEKNNIQNPVIIGHSMGGKVAMNFAVYNPDNLKKLVVVDIGPKAYPVHHTTILEGLKSIKMEEIKSRAEADQILASYVPELDTRQFLLKNLTRDKDGNFKWKINLSAIDQNIEMVGEPITPDHHFHKPTLFVRGQNSNYILDSDFDEIETIFSNVKIETIANAGHWVHAEQPKLFIKTIETFL